MTLFIRFCVWIAITLIAGLVTVFVGMFMNESNDYNGEWTAGAWIASVFILGGSLTVNLIQSGII